MDKLHLWYIRIVLGVKYNSNILATLGECGSLPPSINILTNVFSYFTRLNKMPTTSLTYQAFAESRRLHIVSGPFQLKFHQGDIYVTIVLKVHSYRKFSVEFGSNCCGPLKSSDDLQNQRFQNGGLRVGSKNTNFLISGPIKSYDSSFSSANQEEQFYHNKNSHNSISRSIKG